MSEIQLSIIIPHYNSPDLLIRLLDTIGEHGDIQILVVDDLSTVDIGSILAYANAHTGITLLKNDSGVKGAGAARNVGLKKALGEWLLFADADDTFLPGWYEKVSEYMQGEAQLVYFSPTSKDLTTGKLANRHRIYAGYLQAYAKKPSLKNEMQLRFGFCTPWSKLIRRSVVEEHGVLFDEVMVSNDIMFMIQTAYYAEKFVTDASEIYCVTRGEKTLTSKKNEKNLETRLEILARRNAFLREHLTKKEYKKTNIRTVAMSRLLEIFTDHWGIKKFFAVLSFYKRNNIPWLDFSMFSPRKVVLGLKWMLEIKKHH